MLRYLTMIPLAHGLGAWVLAFGLLVTAAVAQQPADPRSPAEATEPAEEQAAPTTQPAEAGRELVMARVIEVSGDVQYAALGSRDWKPCELDDEYPEQTKIRTGVRSAISFQIGTEEPYTALRIESVGLTLISEAYKTDTVKRVRVGVGYGTIRAGVAEGGLESDFTVDSPVATLSKRGTWDFGLAYERGTDRFEIFLFERGLVEAIDKAQGRRLFVLPGQVVTQAMRRWLAEAPLRRNVPIPDILGQGEFDVAFNRLRNDGLGILNPAGGHELLLDLRTPQARFEFAGLLGGLPVLAIPLLQDQPGTRFRPEGFFGTGRGDTLVDFLIDANSSLAQKGFAKPGTYRFPRSVLRKWLQEYRKD